MPEIVLLQNDENVRFFTDRIVELIPGIDGGGDPRLWLRQVPGSAGDPYLQIDIPLVFTDGLYLNALTVAAGVTFEAGPIVLGPITAPALLFTIGTTEVLVDNPGGGSGVPMSFETDAIQLKRVGVDAYVNFSLDNIPDTFTRTLAFPDADIDLGFMPGNITDADPGDGVGIPNNRSTSIAFTIGAGAETNTLAAPFVAGQQIILSVAAIGTGTRAVTVAGGVNVAGDSTVTFNATTDWILLKAVNIGGALLWREVASQGVVITP